MSSALRRVKSLALAGHWPFHSHAQDVSGRGYHGTVIGMVYADGAYGRMWGSFDGNNDSVNVGDVTQLNSVEAFSLAFWARQNVIDATDYVFTKFIDAANRVEILTATDGFLYAVVANGANAFGRVDYSTLVSAGQPFHCLVAYDGAQTGNANRLAMYINGKAVMLDFSGTTIPATTAALGGNVASIGKAANAWAGLIGDLRLWNITLSYDEAKALYHHSKL